jgi:hypothetical protein
MRCGGCAGSGRALRLDPFGLPVRFSATDTTADGRLRDVELHRERVVLRRSVRGMRMALNMPIAAFDGISLSLLPCEGAVTDILAVHAQAQRSRADAAIVPHVAAARSPGRMAGLERGARNASGRSGKAFDFGLDCASRAAPHRKASPAASPSERTEGTPAVYSSSARVWQDYRSDARPSRRARNHRSKLAYLQRCSFRAPPSMTSSIWSGSTFRKM